MTRLKRWGAGFLILCALILTVIPGCAPKLRQMTVVTASDSKMYYKDEKTGHEFIEMNLSFMPVALKDEYAELKLKSETITLYEIEGLDPEEWLATKDGVVLKEKTIEVKKLSELHLTRVDVFVSSGSSVVIEKITDPDVLAGLGLGGQAGETFDLPLETPAETYLLRMVSEEYPNLYYSVKFLVYGQPVAGYSDNTPDPVPTGRYVIYDTFAKTCWWAEEDLQIMIEGTD